MHRPISQWKIDKREKTIVPLVDMLEFRRDQYGWSKKEMAEQLQMGYTHYTEFLKGKKSLSLNAVRRAYDIGVPASCLLADQNQS